MLLGAVAVKAYCDDLSSEAHMIWLAVILLVAWILGWAVFHIAGALIHLLLVVAVAVFLYRLITGRRTV